MMTNSPVPMAKAPTPIAQMAGQKRRSCSASADGEVRAGETEFIEDGALAICHCGQSREAVPALGYSRVTALVDGRLVDGRMQNRGMNTNLFRDRPLAVVGAGVMGIGIVQVALLAGHPVTLFDAREGAAAAAAGQLEATLAKLVDKGRLDAAQADAARARLRVAASLRELAGAALVVEAIVENLAAKQALLRELEDVVAHDCVLATNTSSISITAIAFGLRLPGRVVGMHFFNPVPLMRLVEVVSGLATEPAVADAVHTLAQDWGKTAVHARSTPGFIVNRIARPFYAETLALLQQRAAAPAVLDACVRGAGFRMGPCELMDLIGHDTNLAVTQSVFEANFFDKRYQPSLVQREMVEGGLLGRKSGRGFFHYGEGGVPKAAAFDEVVPQTVQAPLTLHGADALAELLAARLADAGLAFERVAEGATGLQVGAGHLQPTDGRCAGELAQALGNDDVAVFDWPLGPAAVAPAPLPAALAWAPAGHASAAFVADAQALLRALGWAPQRLADVPGLVVARTVAMLVNEAADAVEQGVCDAEGADAAMTLGVNWPAGPFAWLALQGAPALTGLVDALDAHYRGERYRVSPWLRRATWAAAAPTVPTASPAAR
jgi:3-hydroxybutyryl-CoA dehydrogenase